MRRGRIGGEVGEHALHALLGERGPDERPDHRLEDAATAQVFGGRGAGNILTRATAICAGIFMLTSVSLAYLSSSGDPALRAKVAEEESRRKVKGQKREKEKSDAPANSAGSAAPTTTAPTPTTTDTPSPSPSPAPSP